MRTRTVTTLDLDNGPEVKLWLEPYDDVLQTKVGGRYVVAYNVLDEDAYSCNPLKNHDGNGLLFTNGRSHVITDDLSAVLRHLGLTDMSSRGNEVDLEHKGVDERARSIIRDEVCADPDFSAWCAENFEQDGDTSEEDIFDKCIDWDQGWGSTALPLWLDDKYRAAMITAWWQLYNEGKIGTYLAVPVYYCDSSHGPGTCQISTTDIDSCNAVWVPDKFTISNMTFPEGATYLQKLEVAAKYAESCLKEYEEWCNGEVFGCVVEVFDTQGKQISEESCWGFIGWEWAKAALKDDLFDPVVRAEMLRTPVEEPVCLEEELHL